MDRNDRTAISRRKFIKTGVAGSLLIPLFLDDVGDAFAQPAAKPVLTIAALNGLFKQMHANGPGEARRLYLEAQANLERFFVERFTINPRQLASLREAIAARGPSFQAFIQQGLQKLRSGGAVVPPTAEFNPKLSPYVRVRGFGGQIFACGNARLGALKMAPSHVADKDWAPSSGAFPKAPAGEYKESPLAMDCVFVIDCTALPRAC